MHPRIPGIFKCTRWAIVSPGSTLPATIPGWKVHSTRSPQGSSPDRGGEQESEGPALSQGSESEKKAMFGNGTIGIHNPLKFEPFFWNMACTNRYGHSRGNRPPGKPAIPILWNLGHGEVKA